MSSARRLLRGVLNRLAVLAIVVLTAAALLGGAAILGADELPGSDLSPGAFGSSGEVAAPDGSLFLDRTGQPAVVGEIDNDAGTPITNVTVSVTIYEDGEPIATRETTPLSPTIPDGAAIPYEVRFDTDVEPDEYATNVSYDDGSSRGDDVEVVDAREKRITQHGVTVSGAVTNDGDDPAAQPAAVVTFYDGNGTVIGVRTDQLSALDPGETGEFTARYSTLGDVPSLAGEYASYSVVALDVDDG